MTRGRWRRSSAPTTARCSAGRSDPIARALRIGSQSRAKTGGAKMAKAGDVLEMARLGCSVKLLRTAAETNGELLEFDVLGRPRGFLVQPHVHVGQVERYEVIGGTFKLVEGGREHLLGPGDSMQTGAGVVHRQLPGDGADGHVRVQSRPAGTTQEFLERVA